MGSQPTPPSPGQVLSTSEQGAQQQQNLDIGAQAASQYNQNNWLGNLNYSQTGTGPGGVPIYSASTQLSPAQEQLYGNYLTTQQEAGGAAPSALGFGNYGSVSPTTAIGDMTNGIEGGLMGGWLSSVEPFFQTQAQQLDTTLENQGFTPNSPNGNPTNNPNGPTATGNPAYDNAMRQLQTNQDQAVLGAASQFQPQAFNEATTEYGLPMSVAQQLAQLGAPISPTSQFTSNTPSLTPGNIGQVEGPIASTANAQYLGEQAQYNAMMQGLFGVGAAGLGGMMANGGGAAIGSGLSSLGASVAGMGPFLTFA